MPHTAMVGLFGALAAFAAAALLVGLRRCWRDFGRGTGTGPDSASLRQAVRDIVTLRHLADGDPDQGAFRRWWHHCTFFGFLLCFASTSVAAFYHNVLGWPAPYPLSSVPVLLGSIGGAGLLVGPAGLLWMKLRRPPERQDRAQLGMDLVLLVLLFETSLTGLLLLAARETAAMGRAAGACTSAPSRACSCCCPTASSCTACTAPARSSAARWRRGRRMRGMRCMRVLCTGLALAALACGGQPGTAPEVLTILAPAAPGGGWDQTARAMQAALQEGEAAGGVRVVNVAGAGGTIGLAQFVNDNAERGDVLLVTGLIMVGAVLTNRSAVTLDETTPIARLTGDYEVLVVPDDSPLRQPGCLSRRLAAQSRIARHRRRIGRRHRPHAGRPAGGAGRHGPDRDQLRAAFRRRRVDCLHPGWPGGRGHQRRQRAGGPDRCRPPAGAGHLERRAPAGAAPSRPSASRAST